MHECESDQASVTNYNVGSTQLTCMQADTQTHRRTYLESSGTVGETRGQTRPMVRSSARVQ